jgi:hypothetical protein
MRRSRRAVGSHQAAADNALKSCREIPSNRWLRTLMPLLYTMSAQQTMALHTVLQRP